MIRPTRLFILISALVGGTALAAEAGNGLDYAGMNVAVRPQDDLFRTMNGTWLEKTAIPADKSYWGSFHQLRDLSDQRVRAIVEELVTHPQKEGSVEQKIAGFYKSFIDTAAIDQAGQKPIQPALEAIAQLKTTRDLVEFFGHWQGMLPTPVILTVASDPKNPDRYIATSWQGGIGLPDRDYYLKTDDARLAKVRAAYQTYLETLLTLAGDADAKGNAERVYALEKRIAEGHWDKVDNRNPIKTYNAKSLAELTKLAPGIDWTLYLKTAAFPKVTRLNISQPSQVATVAKLVQEVPLEVWKPYLTAMVLDAHAAMLPQAFRDARFAYRGKALSGAEQEEPRWQQAAKQLDAALGEAVGQVYVARHFPPAYKARMQALVANLMRAYGDSIATLTWMSPATKAKAKDKLANYTVKIGYPDHWRDYSKLAIVAGDPVGNAQRAARFEHERQTRRIHDKVDRREWGMTPQTVNAYYDPSLNEIVFPAAILQPPFFNMAADDAVNYGAIGAVIGHEISHGFDDQGSQFDGKGKLQNWWKPADRAAFEALGAKLVAQYERYEPLPGKFINGKLTLGENIADLSGLQIAYKAYKLSLKGQPAPAIDGRGGDERFFLGWSQAWRGKGREETILQRLMTDPHSPAEYRANGAVVNHDGFHVTFGTKPGDKLYKAPDERIRIW